jgi:multidrug resistance efflux pump
VLAGPRPQEVAAAEAAVAAAQAQLARIQQGALPQEVAAAEAALAGAGAALQKVKEGPSEATLIAARADLANAEAAVRQAQAAYDRVKAQPFAAMLPESLALEQATNALTAARARLTALQDGATAADIAGAAANVQRAQAQLDALKAPARSAEVAAASAEIRRAQAQLALLEAGARPEVIAAARAEVAAAQAGLLQAQAALGETELKAPFAGVVADLTVKVGEQVAPGAPVVVLADLSAWQIETDDLTEMSIGRVHEGDAVVITVDAIPDLRLSGKVSRIEVIGQKKVGDMTYTVVVTPDQHDSRLRWNMTASVTVTAQ